MKSDGDNFRLKACFGWDKSKAEESGGALPSGWNACVGEGVEVPGTLTVWRKLWLFRDQMSGMTPDTSLVPGVFDDAFLEVDVLSGAVTDRGDYLYWGYCWRSDADPDFPHGVGAGHYVHNVAQLLSRYGSNALYPHPPNPLHSIQSQGVEYLAISRCNNPVGNFYWRGFGRWCQASPSIGDNDHTFVAVENINRSDDPSIICFQPQDPGNLNYADRRRFCLDYSVPDSHCASRSVILWRTPPHEVEHAIVYVLDDTTPGCDFSVENRAQMDLSRYGCLFDDRFGGYISRGVIALIRQGAGKQ